MKRVSILALGLSVVTATATFPAHAFHHFYTSSPGEAASINGVDGWSFERVETPIYDYTATAKPPSGTIPLYRMYHPGSRDHFYTADAGEAAAAVGLGYTPEGNVGYVYPAGTSGGDLQDLYRRFNPGDWAHFYTVDPSEGLTDGWKDEGIAAVTPASFADPSAVQLFRFYNGEPDDALSFWDVLGYSGILLLGSWMAAQDWTCEEQQGGVRCESDAPQ